MSSFKSWKLFKFKYVIFIADLYTLHHIQKYVDNTWIIVICVQVQWIFVFDLCYKTGGCKVGKMELLSTYAYEVHPHTWKGKKTFNNEHGSKSYDFFESSVI